MNITPQKLQSSSMESSTPFHIPINLRFTMSQFYFALLILIAGVHSVSSLHPSTQLAGADCAGEIVRFSTCLPYVASYPNNLSSFASSACCDSISSAIDIGDGFCFCYLLRQPLILGFPVNSTRILSLTSVCAPTNPRSVANTSLESNCDASPALPPLQSGSIGPAFTNPNASPTPVESGSPSKSATVTLPPDIAFVTPALETSGSHLMANGNNGRWSFAFHLATFFVAFTCPFLQF